MPAVSIVLFFSLVCFVGIAWALANQLIDVANQLPNYQTNIHRRFDALQGPHGGSLAKAIDNIQTLIKEFATSQGGESAASPLPART